MKEETGFRFLEHTTDLEIEAFGKNLEQAFENAARAVEDTMVDLGTISDSETRKVAVHGRDLEALLYSWIEELISLQETEGLLFSKFVCRISGSNAGFELHGTLKGEKFSPSVHEQKTAIKAPTFHDMDILQTSDKVTMRFVVDL